jgi:solute carrier family 25 protein 38
MYTRSKDWFAGEGRPTLAVNFSSGVCAATVATLLTQPTDVIRTRVQLGLGTAAAGSGSSLAAATGWQTLTYMLKTQGPSALLIGGQAAALPGRPHAASSDRAAHNRLGFMHGSGL